MDDSKPRVVVVPSDRLIIVDGEALRFDYPSPTNLHAVQWYGQQGHMEWTDDFNWPLPPTDITAFEDEVAPYVALWQAEKERLERESAARAAAEAKGEADRLAEYNKPKNVAARKLTVIDAATTAAITAGFDYHVNGEVLHFSYDSSDQQNFADSANVAMLSATGLSGLPASVTWNAYKNWTPESGGELVRLNFGPADFLNLYVGGALAHKAEKMQMGGARKAAVAEALERGATAAEIESI